MVRIERINFVEREPFSLSYRKMGLTLGILMGVFLLLSSLRMARAYFLEKKVSELSSEVMRLKEEQKKILEAATKKTEGGAVLSTQSLLLAYFDQSVNWSLVFRELMSHTSNSVWLTGLKTLEKKDEISKRQLTLTGKAQVADAVPVFVRSLVGSHYFQDVVLTSLERDKNAGGVFYQFSIDLVAGEEARKEKSL